MKITIFVLTDIFVPLLVSLGKEFERSEGARVDYFSMLPRDRQVLEEIGLSPWPQRTCVGDLRAALSDSEYLDLAAFMRLKHGGGDADWLKRCKVVHESINHYLDERCPELLILWNGEDHVGRLFALEARRRGILVIFMENGYFPNTLQIDSVGVNASSSVAKMSFDEFLSLPAFPAVKPAMSVSTSNVVVNEVPRLSKVRRLKNSLVKAVDPAYLKRYPEERGLGIWERRRQAKYWRELPPDDISLPSDFVFIPLQVHDDTQVMLNCRHFTAVEPFVEAAYDSIRQVYGSKMAIVVKEHPVDVGRYDYGPLRAKYPDLIWLQKFDVDLLLDRATAVFVINSSVGLQSIARHKPTVVFGEAFYAKPEVAFRVGDLSEINDVAQRALSGVDRDRAQRIDAFLHQLDARLFTQGGWTSFDGPCLSSIRSRILGLLSNVSN